MSCKVDPKPQIKETFVKTMSIFVFSLNNIFRIRSQQIIIIYTHAKIIKQSKNIIVDLPQAKLIFSNINFEELGQRIPLNIADQLL